MGLARSAALAAALVMLPLGLAGCGLGGDTGDGGEDDRVSVEEAAVKSRERVQAYLDAMKAKDPAAGRGQLCAPMYEAFDASATGPNGDFAGHFTITEATITDVRNGEHGQEVSTSITVDAAGKPRNAALLFTVTRSGTDWCIAAETIGGRPAPTPSATP